MRAPGHSSLKLFIAFIGTVILLCNCSKYKTHCWDVYDALGNQIAIVCGKTEDEISAQYGPYYDRSDAPKYCWTIQLQSGNISYVENLSEKIINIYVVAVSKQKVPCGYCQKWSHREKDLHKATGNFVYQQVRIEQYCGDTCTKLFVGKIVIIRDTPDSLITVEFLQKL